MPLPTSPFVSAKSIFAGKTVIQLKLPRASLAVVTAATTVLTAASPHRLAVGQQVVYKSGTGFTGLVAGTSYFVIAAGFTSSAFSISATSGGTAISVGTSSAGIFHAVVAFESKKLDSKLAQEKKDLSRPDAKGIMRKVRIVLTKSEESFSYVIDEAKRILEIFDGALAGSVDGTATVWTPDPNDAAGKVALMSETDFDVNVTREGDGKFGDSAFTEFNIQIESLKAGPVLWTEDAVA